MSKEREKEILKIMLANKKVTVKELSKQLFASESSVRRDLVRLEKQQLIKRIHGGAVIEENSASKMRCEKSHLIFYKIRKQCGNCLVSLCVKVQAVYCIFAVMLRYVWVNRQTLIKVKNGYVMF